MKPIQLINLLVLNGITLFLWTCQEAPTPNKSGTIMTIMGPLSTDSMGVTLIHEHVFLDWGKADSIDKSKWNEEKAFEIILPYLIEMKEQGVRTFLECTPAYLGRNPLLLQRLSEASGLQILTNTGFYAARKKQHIPSFAFDISSEELSDIWIQEFENGIEGTEIRPGFIKIGMDSKDELEEIDQKLVRAAAKTHLATGLTIVSHTGTDTTAIQELALLAQEGVSPDAFVWTHAQRGTKKGHIALAKRGAWISLDGLGWISPDPVSQDSSQLFMYIDFLKNLKENDLLHRTLISHDAGWYTVGQAEQTNYKAYTPIFELVIPLLQKEGFTSSDVEQLLIKNPAIAYDLHIYSHTANKGDTLR